MSTEEKLQKALLLQERQQKLIQDLNEEIACLEDELAWDSLDDDLAWDTYEADL